ncbi:MAG: GTPase [Actinomycetes bacterium]|nr:MAG: ABC transporter [Actinomycetota bacterium]
MSPTFQTLPPRTETSRLKERVDRLRASMEWAKEAIPPAVRDEVHATIARCDERLALGVDHTIVALAGGTGSGKSSLFNALTGTEFAVPGVTRPTTSHVSAATWGSADALLDWLGVAPEHRIALGADANAGIVLLDLPDHDSVNADNRATVDRVVPLADLIVWVVDPQKYADHALHSAYLSVASDHGQPSLVVLNQVDRLSEEDATAVAQDLARLVHSEGLTNVPVLLVSARTGRGVDSLRAEIAQAASSRSVAAEAVRADLVAAGRQLEQALARDAEPVLPDVKGLVGALARAAGVEARAEAAADVAAGRLAKLPEVLEAPESAVAQIRLEWIDAATAGLPVEWRRVVDDAVLSASALAEELNASLRAIDWPPVARPAGLARVLRRKRAAGAAARLTRAIGRDVVRSVVTPHVVEPTTMIHEAYRNLDELAELE